MSTVTKLSNEIDSLVTDLSILMSRGLALLHECENKLRELKLRRDDARNTERAAIVSNIVSLLSSSATLYCKAGAKARQARVALELLILSAEQEAGRDAYAEVVLAGMALT